MFILLSGKEIDSFECIRYNSSHKEWVMLVQHIRFLLFLSLDNIRRIFFYFYKKNISFDFIVKAVI